MSSPVGGIVWEGPGGVASLEEGSDFLRESIGFVVAHAYFYSSYDLKFS